VPVVEIPERVRHDAPCFAAGFSPEALEQLQRDVSGWIVPKQKTVDWINRLLVIDVRHQSRLKRLLTKNPCTVNALNQARLHRLSRLPGTQRKPKDVLSVDDTLWTHEGQHFELIASLYDSTPG
jgi:hypothetical protein